MRNAVPLAALLLALLVPRAWAEDPSPATSEQSEDGLSQLLTRIAVGLVPREHTDKRGWGNTARVVSGIEVHTRGLKVHTRRRYRTVNDGTWKMYRIRLIDPERNLRLRIDDVRYVGDGRIGFDVSLQATIRVLGRVQQWARGVRLASASSEAEATVRLELGCTAGAGIDATHGTPAVVLRPEVTGARVTLVGFRLLRVGTAGGPLVRELGRQLRRVVNDRLAAQDARLVEKINRRIEANRDHLRLSLAEVVQSGLANLLRKAAKSGDSNTPRPQAADSADG